MTNTSSHPNSRDYEFILKSGVPLLDVRAPLEFAHGAFAQSTNLPLMQDHERAAVGTCYKKSGSQAAILLGHSLVKSDIRAARTAEWVAWAASHPEGYICCARGGLRSHIVQEWLHEAGVNYPLVEGGYRALRQHALSRLADLVLLPMVVVGGNTGCGKTTLIQALDNGIDLEGLACHRGSSFGRTLRNQPTQASFEHNLALDMMQCQQSASRFFWVMEDEGKMIGARHLPDNLRTQMCNAPIVVIDDPFELRLNRLRHEYLSEMLTAFLNQTDDVSAGWQAFEDYLQHGLFAIRRRLGMARYTLLNSYLIQSLAQHKKTGKAEVHYSWLVPLLKEYYDPMYRYQLDKKCARIVYKGDSQQVMAWLVDKRQTGLA